MKKTLFALIIISLVVAIGYTVLQISKSRSFQFFGTIIPRIETNRKVVALTFDDAPTQSTLEVLSILATDNTKATFYMIGENIEKYPDIAKKITIDGHELGNHSYSHQRLWFKSYDFVAAEVNSTNALIRSTGYSKEITFRPPFGKKLFILPYFLAQNNIKTIMADVEPDTYYGGDVEGMVDYTLANTKPGSIILMHPLCEGACKANREALPRIVSGLKSKGFEFVTVSELLQ